MNMVYLHIELKDKNILKQSKTFSLNVQQEFIVGASKQKSDLYFEHQALESEHLSILFDQGQLLIADKDTENGTLRLPSKGYFVEDRFLINNKIESVDLKINEITINIKWSFNKELIYSLKSTGVQLQRREPPKSSNKVNKENQVNLSHKRAVKPQVKQQHYFGRSWSVLLLFFICSLGVVLFLTWDNFSPLIKYIQANQIAFSKGIMLDFLYILIDVFHSYSFFFKGLAFLTILLLVYFVFSNKKISASKKSIELFCCFSFLGLIIGVFFLSFYLNQDFNINTKHYQDLSQLRKILKDKPKNENDTRDYEKIKSNAQKIRSLAKSLKGSSYLYHGLMAFERNRVIRTCKGSGQKPWKKKKLCLALLSMLSYETYDSVKPALIWHASKSQALIDAFEGLLRIVSYEGVEQLDNKVFLRNISLLNNQDDVQMIKKYLTNKTANRKEVFRYLQLIKYKTSKFLLDDYSNQLPKDLQFRYSSAIELGL